MMRYPYLTSMVALPLCRSKTLNAVVIPEIPFFVLNQQNNFSFFKL